MTSTTEWATELFNIQDMKEPNISLIPNLVRLVKQMSENMDELSLENDLLRSRLTQLESKVFFGG